MTGVKGNSKFCLRVEGKENFLFPVGPVMKFFFSYLNSKIEQIINVCHPLIQVYCKMTCKFATVSRCITYTLTLVNSSSCCFPRELVSSVCPLDGVRCDVTCDMFLSNQKTHLSCEI